MASYLDLAENLFLLKVFRKIESNKINNKSFKKIYFVDPFIYRVMKRYTKGLGTVEESEIPHIIEGIVGEHLAREYGRVGYTFFKGGKEVDFVVGNLGIEVKWGRGDYKDLKMDRGYVLTFDDMELGENKAILPVSVFLYLMSSNKIFYEL